MVAEAALVRIGLSRYVCSILTPDRNLDLLMLAQYNSLERSATQWSALLQRADPWLQLTRIVNLEGSLMSVVEVVWGISSNQVHAVNSAIDTPTSVEMNTHHVPGHILSPDEEPLDQK